jgi:hypothetical protein
MEVLGNASRVPIIVRPKVRPVRSPNGPSAEEVPTGTLSPPFRLTGVVPTGTLSPHRRFPYLAASGPFLHVLKSGFSTLLTFPTTIFGCFLLICIFFLLIVGPFVPFCAVPFLDLFWIGSVLSM